MVLGSAVTTLVYGRYNTQNHADISKHFATSNPQDIASMRLTRGTFTSDNTPFTRFDCWINHESANLDMLGHWIGTTTFSDYDCANVDGHVQQLCALHNSDVHMRSAKRVIFDEATKTHYDITG